MHCIPPNSRPIYNQGKKQLPLSCCKKFNLYVRLFFHTVSEFSQISDDADQTMLGEVKATSTGVHTLHNVIGTTENAVYRLNKMHKCISEIWENVMIATYGE